jgi:diaminohydroxyphosphoribosylaminopyrimidine deaminase/5-amino-6-(5-phosphoribosylamino)uracil reductase
MVGAVVVDADGVVVGRGTHEFAGGPHAEVHALRQAGERAKGATLYSTLEPCSHTGRTGPCAPLVVDAGIRRAVIAIEDPNPRVSGRGLDYMRTRGIEVRLGVRRDEAERLNLPFFTFIQYGRPFVTMKAALSLDGCVAAKRGERTALTGPAAARLIHRERAEIDAVAVGSETVLVDDPLLTARHSYRYRPLVRVVFDRRLRTPPAARLLTTLSLGPVLIFTTASSLQHSRAAALQQAGAELEIIDAEASAGFLKAALERLGARGVTSLLIEGGPALHEAFWQAGLVDRVELFVSPQAVGSEGVEWIASRPGSFAGLRELSASPVGNDVLIEGYVHRSG